MRADISDGEPATGSRTDARRHPCSWNVQIRGRETSLPPNDSIKRQPLATTAETVFQGPVRNSARDGARVIIRNYFIVILQLLAHSVLHQSAASQAGRLV